jgi:ABC-2 type transport system ATP-binding protein
VTEPAIRVRGLRKSYGDVHAVAGVDLDVATGECVALLGPNGAGKTTTTEILEGYRRRDAGEASVLGVDPARAGARWRARVGIVLQSVSDLTDLTVDEAVRHFAGYYAQPRDAGEVIDLVGLTEKRRTRVTALSGGQRRRLDVGLGIVGRPELLFLDEPTTGFDPEARRVFWTLVELLKAEGTTILLTTHYLDEAEVLADRVAVISRGRVLACDVPEHLGGRRVGVATVAWNEDGAARSQETEHPTAFVAALAERLGGEVPQLTVTRPTLEDVYLAMVAADTSATDTTDADEGLPEERG